MRSSLFSLFILLGCFSFGISSAFAQDNNVVVDVYPDQATEEYNSNNTDPAYVPPDSSFNDIEIVDSGENQVYPHYPAQNGDDIKDINANESAYYDEMAAYENAFYGLLIGGGISAILGSTLISLDFFIDEDPEYDPSRPMAVTGYVFLGVGIVACIASGIVWTIGRNKFADQAALEFGNDSFRVSPNLVATPQFTGATFDMRF